MTETDERLTSALADRYAIERELGQGGMATVYLAEDLKHHRKVAVKVLRPELAAILGGERFLKEIEVTANLQHPNILPLYDSGEADSFLYYVMPHVEGESLRQKLDREKQLGVSETMDIAKGVAGALHFAHEHGVVHRDIKPENILLQSGQPLVADFGIALAVSQAGGTRLTETGLSLGTPHYMSPEQATGDRDVDARSDIYSLGVLVYEMLAGEPPYLGNSVQAIIAKILSERPASLAQTRDRLPTNIDAAVQQALSKSPADRFSSAAEFAAALQNPGFTLPTLPGIVVESAPPLEAPGPTWDRKTVGAVGVAGIAVIVAFLGWLRPSPTPEASVVRYAMALPEDQALAPARGSRIAIAPNGGRIAIISLGEDGVPRIVLRARNSFVADPVPGTAGSSHVFYAPDGSRLGFIDQGATNGIKVSSQSGGPPITVADSAVGLDGATWSGDGFIYFDGLTAGGTTGIERIMPDGTGRALVTVVDTASGETDHVWPQTLPDGDGILFQVTYRQGTDRGLAIKRASDDEHRVVLEVVTGRYFPSGHLVYVTSGGVLMGARFDLEELEIVGEPIALDDGVGIRQFGSVDLSVSENGVLLYVAGESIEAPDELVWVDRQGRAEPIDSGWTGQFREVALSPDGTRLAISLLQGEDRQIWTKQLPDGPLSKLTFEGLLSQRPSWSPDGRFVFYISNRNTAESIWRKRADGSTRPELVLTPAGRTLGDASLTRDGEWLVYGTVPRDVFARRIGDTTSVALMAGRFAEITPAVSPDGRWIAYLSDESGQFELYVRPFPGTSDAKWQVSDGGAGFSVFWAPDGSELFYTATGSGGIDLMVAEVVAAETFTVGDVRRLFDAQSYGTFPGAIDITPDGQRFVMIRDQASRTPNMISGLKVVEHIDAELRAKLGQ